MNLAITTRHLPATRAVVGPSVVSGFLIGLSFVHKLSNTVSSMHVSLGSDRLGLKSHACTSALRCTGPVRSSDRPARWNCCTCSAAARISGTGDEEPQLVGFGCIGQATRAVKHAYRLTLSQAQRFQALQLADRSESHHTGESASEKVRNPRPLSQLCLLLGAAVLPGKGFADLGQNYVFMAGFWGWFLAQSCKIFTKRWRKGVWDLKAIVDSGGMPSSHSALCSAITTATAMEFGLGSSLFAVSIAFSSIVMYDAAGVRRHAGKQAEVLNILLEDLLEGHAVSETKLKEVLGHTPIQVCVGALLGLLVGLFFPIPPAISVA